MAEKNFGFPDVTVKTRVISSHLQCKDAVLVKVENGAGTLRFEAAEYGYEAVLGEESLFSVDESGFCETCGGYLVRGYGQRNLSMEEAMGISEKINDTYNGIEDAAARIRPLLGMLKGGYYIAADYELFPLTGQTHFWNSCSIPDRFTARAHMVSDEHRVNVYRPSSLIASEPASACNPQRVNEYMKRLKEGEAYPRAVGCYLSANSVLLLDGHHKAAAAAARGQMVKCLVIIPAFPDDGFDNFNLAEGPLLLDGQCLMNQSGKPVGKIGEFFGPEAVEHSEEKTDPKPADFAQWGRLPDNLAAVNEKTYRHIPTDAMQFEVFHDFEEARECVQGVFWELMQKKQQRPQSSLRAQLIWFLSWYQGGYIRPRRSGKHVMNVQPEAMEYLLTESQWQRLHSLISSLGLDRDPKTANLVPGVFSFYPGQKEVTQIPERLEERLKRGTIHTVLIPDTVQTIDQSVFERFPDLETIVVEKGSTYFRDSDFEALLQEAERPSRHLTWKPFENLSEMVKVKKF